jgi:hypothetical protein
MQSESTDIEEILLSELECPVCTEYMWPPITLCENGHNICDICRPKLDECPTCRKRFLNTRNVVLEKLARRVKYPCSYRQFGCKEMFAHDMLDEHQVKCWYRVLTCPAARCFPGIKCDWTGNYYEVTKHLIENHLEICCDYREVESRSFLGLCFHGWYNKCVFVYNEVFFPGFFWWMVCFMLLCITLVPLTMQLNTDTWLSSLKKLYERCYSNALDQKFW